MFLYEHEDQCAMFKGKQFRSMLMEYQSILLQMLMKVAQRAETEWYEHKSRVPVNLIGKSLFILKDSNFGLGYIEVKNNTSFCT